MPQLDSSDLSHSQVIAYLKQKAKGEPITCLPKGPPRLDLQAVAEMQAAASAEKEDSEASNDSQQQAGSHLKEVTGCQLAGKKRLRPLALNAVRKGEIDNSVEFAYL